MSHNIYNENKEITLKKLPNYLIFIENPETGNPEIIPCENITKAIKIASEEKAICSLFEINASIGKFWRHLCDISKGVI